MKDYIEKNKDKFLKELIELLKIPSVSADPNYEKDVQNAAIYIKNRFEDLKITAKIYPTSGHPIVYAEKIIDHHLPTILVYGHYDVQPADPLELWDSPPFEPIIKNDKIYARGACDDKGQMYMHIKALETLLHTNNLKCNMKYLIEGEEEVGSKNLDYFVIKHKDLLKADTILISDTSMISMDTPSIAVGMRGLSYIQIELTGPNRDLHSGVYGGAIANPNNVLCDLIASLHDTYNKVNIPGFYDDVQSLSVEERKAMNDIPFDIQEYKNYLGINELKGEEGFTTLERVGARPTLDVNGIWGGYTGAGAKTVIPSKAYAKISMRLVPDQNSEKITELVINYLHKMTPKYVRLKTEVFHGGEPAKIDIKNKGFQAAHISIKEALGNVPIPTLEGGSIPIVALFKKELNIDPILMGFGLDSDAIHSPNENYGLFNYYKGIETICRFNINFYDLFR